MAVMRGKIQLDSSTPYIVLGSVRNKMTDIFWNPDSPFYHSAASLPVGEIPEDDFYQFAASKFYLITGSVQDYLIIFHFSLSCRIRIFNASTDTRMALAVFSVIF